MKKFSLLISLVALCGLVFVAPIWAQETSSWKPPKFLPGTVKNYSGEVEGVMQRSLSLKPGEPLREILVMKTPDGKSLEVVMGPPGYLAKQNFVLNPGDKVAVRGVKHPHPGENTIVATEVRKGNQVLRLRDDKGKELFK